MNDIDWRRLVVTGVTAVMVAACSGGTPSVAPSVTPPSPAPASLAAATSAPPSVQASPSPAAATPVPSVAPSPSPATTATDKVSIVDFGFDPSANTVKAGTKVTWTNHGRTHTVTADDGSFASGSIGPGGTYSMTFKKAGTYAYHCAIHSSMVAQVVVTP
jgi:plastocyanin